MWGLEIMRLLGTQTNASILLVLNQKYKYKNNASMVKKKSSLNVFIFIPMQSLKYNMYSLIFMESEVFHDKKASA